MKLRPLHDWVLLKRGEPAGKSVGGIIIPESAKEKQSEGTVEAVGPGRIRKGKKGEKFVPTVLKPGQRVFFTDYAARDINLDEELITVIREEDILGTLEGAAAGMRPIGSEEGRAGSKKEEKSVKSKAVTKTEKTTGKSESRGKTGKAATVGKSKKKASGVASSKKETGHAKKKVKPKKVSAAGKPSKKKVEKKKPLGKPAGRASVRKVAGRRTKVSGKKPKKVARGTKKTRK
jgi:chaperonin GroES